MQSIKHSASNICVQAHFLHSGTSCSSSPRNTVAAVQELQLLHDPQARAEDLG